MYINNTGALVYVAHNIRVRISRESVNDQINFCYCDTSEVKILIVVEYSK